MMSDLLEDVIGTHCCYQEPLLTTLFGKTLRAETDYVNPEQIIREKRENLHGAYDPEAGFLCRNVERVWVVWKSVPNTLPFLVGRLDLFSCLMIGYILVDKLREKSRYVRILERQWMDQQARALVSTRDINLLCQYYKTYAQIEGWKRHRKITRARKRNGILEVRTAARDEWVHPVLWIEWINDRDVLIRYTPQDIR